MRDEQRKRLSLVPRGERTFTRKTEGMAGIGQMLPRPNIQKPQTPPPPELVWECPVCGIVEPRARPTGDWARRKCQCQIDAVRAEESRVAHETWLSAQQSRTYGGWLGQHWVDKEIVREMSQKTFAKWNRRRFPEAFRVAQQFASNPRGNLLLVGDNGTGKTFLASAILNYLMTEGILLPNGEREYIGGLIASAPEFFTAYFEAKKKADQTDAIRIMDSARTAKVFVLDDGDKLRATDPRLETLFLILDERFKARRPTILTANHEMKDLTEYLGEGVVSRLMRGLYTLPMYGVDYRTLEKA